MAKYSVKAYANVNSGWMCAWCDIENRYVHNAAGSFNVCNYLHHMECCNILEKAAQIRSDKKYEKEMATWQE